jgi:hypothetical protein
VLACLCAEVASGGHAADPGDAELVSSVAEGAAPPGRRQRMHRCRCLGYMMLPRHPPRMAADLMF